MSDTDETVADKTPAAPDAPEGETARKPLSPAAERALAEAAARRAEIDRKTAERPTELNGRGGLEPVRYGDWEIKGIASDF
ncbi:MAG: DUF1674 domain-containing protein [Xanthobacteraceae bacterium]